MLPSWDLVQTVFRGISRSSDILWPYIKFRTHPFHSLSLTSSVEKLFKNWKKNRIDLKKSDSKKSTMIWVYTWGGVDFSFYLIKVNSQSLMKIKYSAYRKKIVLYRYVFFLILECISHHLSTWLAHSWKTSCLEGEYFFSCIQQAFTESLLYPNLNNGLSDGDTKINNVKFLTSKK